MGNFCFLIRDFFQNTNKYKQVCKGFFFLIYRQSFNI